MKLYGLVLEDNHPDCYKLMRILKDDRVLEGFTIFYSHIRPDVIDALPAEELHFPSLVLFDVDENNQPIVDSFELVETGVVGCLIDIRNILGDEGYGANKKLVGDEEE